MISYRSNTAKPGVAAMKHPVFQQNRFCSHSPIGGKWQSKLLKQREGRCASVNMLTRFGRPAALNFFLDPNEQGAHFFQKLKPRLARGANYVTHLPPYE